MLLEDIRQLKTGPHDLRKFGLVVGTAFLVLAAWTWWRGKAFYMDFAVPGGVLILLGAAWPRALKWLYLPWMALGLVLGLIMSTLLLTVFYYLIVTPLALLARAFGNDFLSRRLDRSAPSYWLDRTRSRKKPRESYERQF